VASFHASGGLAVTAGAAAGGDVGVVHGRAFKAAA
jgi:hypothetical protein